MVEVASCIPVKFRSAFIWSTRALPASTCACVPTAHQECDSEAGNERVAPHAAAHRASQDRVVSFPILIMAAVAVEASTIDVCGWKKHRARKEQDPFLQWPQRPYDLLLPSFQWLIIISFRSSYFFTTLLPCCVTDNPLISHSAVCINCVLRHTMTQFCSTFG